jgi:hypothetical protein
LRCAHLAALFNKWHFTAAAFVQKRAIKAIKQPGALSACDDNGRRSTYTASHSLSFLEHSTRHFCRTHPRVAKRVARLLLSLHNIRQRGGDLICATSGARTHILPLASHKALAVYFIYGNGGRPGWLQNNLTATTAKRHVINHSHFFLASVPFAFTKCTKNCSGFYIIYFSIDVQTFILNKKLTTSIS